MMTAFAESFKEELERNREISISEKIQDNIKYSQFVIELPQIALKKLKSSSDFIPLPNAFTTSAVKEKLPTAGKYGRLPKINLWRERGSRQWGEPCSQKDWAIAYPQTAKPE